MPRGRSLLLAPWLAAMLALSAAAASPELSVAEQVRSGNLVLSIRGGVTPLRLPRHRRAPASAWLYTRLAAADRPLPSVRSIELSFGGAASLASHGLPVCPRARLRNATSRDALRRCGGALVGGGRLMLEVRLPGQLPLRRDPRLLVFNGRQRGGGRMLWAHVFAAEPPISFVLPFQIRRAPGSFATTLSATVPRPIGRFTRISGFAIRLGRLYRRHGLLRSFLYASCPVPRPFTTGFFPIAAATYGFAGGRVLGEEIVRSCQVAR